MIGSSDLLGFLQAEAEEHLGIMWKYPETVKLDIGMIERKSMEEILPAMPQEEKEDIRNGQGGASKTQGILSGAHKTCHAEEAVLEGDKVRANSSSMAKDG